MLVADYLDDQQQQHQPASGQYRYNTLDKPTCSGFTVFWCARSEACHVQCEVVKGGNGWCCFPSDAVISLLGVWL